MRNLWPVIFWLELAWDNRFMSTWTRKSHLSIDLGMLMHRRLHFVAWHSEGILKGCWLSMLLSIKWTFRSIMFTRGRVLYVFWTLWRPLLESLRRVIKWRITFSCLSNIEWSGIDAKLTLRAHLNDCTIFSCKQINVTVYIKFRGSRISVELIILLTQESRALWGLWSLSLNLFLRKPRLYAETTRFRESIDLLGGWTVSLIRNFHLGSCVQSIGHPVTHFWTLRLVEIRHSVSHHSWAINLTRRRRNCWLRENGRHGGYFVLSI